MDRQSKGKGWGSFSRAWKLVVWKVLDAPKPLWLSVWGPNKCGASLPLDSIRSFIKAFNFPGYVCIYDSLGYLLKQYN